MNILHTEDEDAHHTLHNPCRRMGTVEIWNRLRLLKATWQSSMVQTGRVSAQNVCITRTSIALFGSFFVGVEQGTLFPFHILI